MIVKGNAIRRIITIFLAGRNRHYVVITTAVSRQKYKNPRQPNRGIAQKNSLPAAGPEEKFFPSR